MVWEVSGNLAVRGIVLLVRLLNAAVRPAELKQKFF